jgi:hypothetical protein
MGREGGDFVFGRIGGVNDLRLRREGAERSLRTLVTAPVFENRISNEHWLCY